MAFEDLYENEKPEVEEIDVTEQIQENIAENGGEDEYDDNEYWAYEEWFIAGDIGDFMTDEELAELEKLITDAQEAIDEVFGLGEPTPPPELTEQDYEEFKKECLDEYRSLRDIDDESNTGC